MKKKKIIQEFDAHHGFVIFSLNASQEDFKVAYQLNKYADLHLQRDENLLVYQDEKSDPVPFSFFYCNRDKRTSFYLIYNLQSQESLIKNYFLLISGYFSYTDQQKLLEVVSKMPDILSINPLSLTPAKNAKKSQLKTIELINLILNDLEYHTLAISKKQNDSKVQLKQTSSGNLKKLFDR